MIKKLGWVFLGTWFVATLICATAWADTVTLKDGTVLEGQVKSMDRRQVVIEVSVGSGKATAVMTLERADVASFQLGDGGKPPAKPGKRSGKLPFERTSHPRARKAPSSGADRLDPAAGRVVILLDRSGSMAIGARWEQALDQVARLVSRMKRGARYDVLGFGGAVRSLLGKNTWLARRDWSAKRLRKRLAATPPDLRLGTDLRAALRGALARHPTRVVVITDGVVTRGGLEALERTRAVVAEAAERGVRVDTISVQDGRYHAPQVEDLGAARTLLGALARAGKGVFVAVPERPRPKPLPQAFTPLPGAPRASKRPRSWLAWINVSSKKPIRARELRPYPTFRVRVLDVGFLVGKPLDVWEYGGSVSYSVVIRDGNGVELARADGLRLRRAGNFLEGTQAIRLVGPSDKSSPRDRRAKDYRIVPALEGATVEVIYRRGNVTLVDRRKIAVTPQPVYPG